MPKLRIMLGQRPYSELHGESGRWMPTPYGRSIAVGYTLNDNGEEVKEYTHASNP